MKHINLPIHEIIKTKLKIRYVVIVLCCRCHWVLWVKWKANSDCTLYKQKTFWQAVSHSFQFQGEKTKQMNEELKWPRGWLKCIHLPIWRFDQRYSLTDPWEFVTSQFSEPNWIQFIRRGKRMQKENEIEEEMILYQLWHCGNCCFPIHSYRQNYLHTHSTYMHRIDWNWCMSMKQQTKYKLHVDFVIRWCSAAQNLSFNAWDYWNAISKLSFFSCF